VLEVDEAALPALLPGLRPRAALFLNLFRDQLDRYGEVDSVAEGWHEMLIADASGLTLVLNADDPAVARLGDAARGEVVTFGLEDRAAALPGVEHAADARFCGCGAPFRYEAVFLGHLGVWRCDGCGRARPAPDVAAREVVATAGGMRFELEIAGERSVIELPLEGLYAIYNALGAAAAAHAVGIEGHAIGSALRDAGPAFGRQEMFELEGRELRLWLAKNPVGLNAVLRTLAPAGAGADEPPLHLLAVLNDGIQDGRDVSWIYDADIELLAGRAGSLVASGDRAEDLALRCALAGLDVHAVQPHRASALDEALRRTPEGGRLEVVATYTAMLELRELVAAGVGAAPYWEHVGRS
jgi:UDP-N-acetylmuramyl tripeptide synthase